MWKSLVANPSAFSQKRPSRQAASQPKSAVAHLEEGVTKPSASTMSQSAVTSSSSILLDIPLPPVEFVKQRLRELQEPVTYFGEGNEERYERLQKLSVVAEGKRRRTGSFTGPGSSTAQLQLLQKQEEDFAHDALEKLRDALQIYSEKTTTTALLQNQKSSTEKEDAQLITDRMERFVLHTLQRYLLEWDIEMAAKNNDDTATPARLTATYTTTRRDIEPLLRRLREHQANEDIIRHLSDIWHSVVVDSDYVRAEELYFRLSIGEDPWPYGIPLSLTHSQVTRERISVTKVRHWMNNDVVQRYVHAVHNLLRHVQEMHPSATHLML